MSRSTLRKNTNIMINNLRTALYRLNETQDDYDNITAQVSLDEARVCIRKAIQHLERARNSTEEG